jgi:hypothetical protein
MSTQAPDMLRIVWLMRLAYTIQVPRNVTSLVDLLIAVLTRNRPRAMANGRTTESTTQDRLSSPTGS